MKRNIFFEFAKNKIHGLLRELRDPKWGKIDEVFSNQWKASKLALFISLQNTQETQADDAFLGFCRAVAYIVYYASNACLLIAFAMLFVITLALLAIPIIGLAHLLGGAL